MTCERMPDVPVKHLIMNLPGSHSVSGRECQEHVVSLLLVQDNDFFLENESHFIIIKLQIDCGFIYLYTYQSSNSLILNLTGRLRDAAPSLTHVIMTTITRSSGKAQC